MKLKATESIFMRMKENTTISEVWTHNFVTFELSNYFPHLRFTVTLTDPNGEHNKWDNTVCARTASPKFCAIRQRVLQQDTGTGTLGLTIFSNNTDEIRSERDTQIPCRDCTFTPEHS